MPIHTKNSGLLNKNHMFQQYRIELLEYIHGTFGMYAFHEMNKTVSFASLKSFFN